MSRSVRIEFPGAFYHVLARGNRREAIYRDDENRRYFLKVLSEACGRTGWPIHAWVLMNNHYHILVETPEANLVEGEEFYYQTLIDYLHLNPARARLVNPENDQSVLDYAWRSVAGG
jgi:hypothetical protein